MYTLRSCILTFVYAGDPVLEVHQGREVINAVFLGLSVVVYLNEGDAGLLTVIVNVLQLTQHLMVLGILLVIFRSEDYVRETTNNRKELKTKLIYRCDVSYPSQVMHVLILI